MRKLIAMLMLTMLSFGTITVSSAYAIPLQQHMTKSGKPDKRFKENKHLKKEGTPDMRYKSSKSAMKKK